MTVAAPSCPRATRGCGVSYNKNKQGDRMRKLLLVAVCLAALTIFGCDKAEAHSESSPAPADHSHEKSSDHEKFDYGLFLDAVLFETEDGNVEVISRTTWEVQREEVTVLLGAKVKVMSIFNKEK